VTTMLVPSVQAKHGEEFPRILLGYSARKHHSSKPMRLKSTRSLLQLARDDETTSLASTLRSKGGSVLPCDHHHSWLSSCGGGGRGGCLVATACITVKRVLRSTLSVRVRLLTVRFLFASSTAGFYSKPLVLGYQFLIEELQLWGVGRTGLDIPARGARATVQNEWCRPS
jgi:hypothetical protein